MVIGLLKHLDGTISTVHFNESFDGDKLEHLNHIKALTDNVELVDDSALPLHAREFREAWRHDLSIDMVKAKEIKMIAIRKDRDIKLKDSDLSMMIAVEMGNEDRIEELKGKRQALRDLPDNINLDIILTVEDLLSFRPSLLDEVL